MIKKIQKYHLIKMLLKNYHYYYFHQKKILSTLYVYALFIFYSFFCLEEINSFDKFFSYPYWVYLINLA